MPLTSYRSTFATKGYGGPGGVASPGGFSAPGTGPVESPVSAPGGGFGNFSIGNHPGGGQPAWRGKR